MSEANEDVKADMAMLTAMAKRLGLKGGDVDKYVHEHMTKLGYSNRRSYFKKERGADSGSGGGFLGGLFGGGGSPSDDDDE